MEYTVLFVTECGNLQDKTKQKIKEKYNERNKPSRLHIACMISHERWLIHKTVSASITGEILSHSVYAEKLIENNLQ